MFLHCCCFCFCFWFYTRRVRPLHEDNSSTFPLVGSTLREERRCIFHALLNSARIRVVVLILAGSTFVVNVLLDDTLRVYAPTRHTKQGLR